MMPVSDASNPDAYSFHKPLLPVIRLFGSTPANQKVCAMIHNVFPYFYILMDAQFETNGLEIEEIKKQLEAVLAESDKRVSIQKIEVVKGRSVYGYVKNEQIFLKVYIINPAKIKLAAQALISGNILQHKFSVFEAHIPYILQFKADFNIFGCNFVDINLNQMCFRQPLPTSASTCYSGQLWLHSNSYQYCSPAIVKKLSTCELELDVYDSDALLNRYELRNYDLQKIKLSDKVVNSLRPIFQELGDIDVNETLINVPNMDAPSCSNIVQTSEMTLTQAHPRKVVNVLKIVDIANRAKIQQIRSALNDETKADSLQESQNITQSQESQLQDKLKFVSNFSTSKRSLLSEMVVESLVGLCEGVNNLNESDFVEIERTFEDNANIPDSSVESYSKILDLVEDEETEKVKDDESEWRDIYLSQHASKFLETSFEEVLSQNSVEQNDDEVEIFDRYKIPQFDGNDDKEELVRSSSRAIGIRSKRLSSKNVEEFDYEVILESDVGTKYMWVSGSNLNKNIKGRELITLYNNSVYNDTSNENANMKRTLSFSSVAKKKKQVSFSNVTLSSVCVTDINDTKLCDHGNFSELETLISTPVIDKIDKVSSSTSKTNASSPLFVNPTAPSVSLSSPIIVISSQLAEVCTNILCYKRKPPEPEAIWRDINKLNEFPGSNEACNNLQSSLLGRVPQSHDVKAYTSNDYSILSVEVRFEENDESNCHDPRVCGISSIEYTFLPADTESALSLANLNLCTQYIYSSKIGQFQPRGKIVCCEINLLHYFAHVVNRSDPDFVCGYEVQKSSLGFMIDRYAILRWKLDHKSQTSLRKEEVCKDCLLLGNSSYNLDISMESLSTRKVYPKDGEISFGIYLNLYRSLLSRMRNFINPDPWLDVNSGVLLSGRIVINIWRILRQEVPLTDYSFESVVFELLKIRIPNVISAVFVRTHLNLLLLSNIDYIARTCESARVFGCDWNSVSERGSQYRVESMLIRLLKSQNFMALSPSKQQVSDQASIECMALTLEPLSGFYRDPVLVLDFRSLYPSIMMANNICYSTCLGKTSCLDGVSKFGVGALDSNEFLNSLGNQNIWVSRNGVAFVTEKVRKGFLPRLVFEILQAREMIKKRIKKLKLDNQLHDHEIKLLNARQLSLKLIANVIFGYTSAGYSGRMPCVDIADTIVETSKACLNDAIDYVNNHDVTFPNRAKWKAEVVYGDTDSLFIKLQGCNLEESFKIGRAIADEITARNKSPVKLQFEKVFYPCVLITKKRYVGYSYDAVNLKKSFDAKGIETVRRDTCELVSNTMERALKLLFDSSGESDFKLISIIKKFMENQYDLIYSNSIPLNEFIFAKEVKLGHYKNVAIPPCSAAVAIKKVQRTKNLRNAPLYKERIPYIVTCGGPFGKTRLIDTVRSPEEVLSHEGIMINYHYYITKHIIPSLSRVFDLIENIRISSWYELYKPKNPVAAEIPIPLSFSMNMFGLLNKMKLERVGKCVDSTGTFRVQLLPNLNTYYCSTNFWNSHPLKENSDVLAAPLTKHDRLHKFNGPIQKTLDSFLPSLSLCPSCLEPITSQYNKKSRLDNYVYDPYLFLCANCSSSFSVSSSILKVYSRARDLETNWNLLSKTCLTCFRANILKPEILDCTSTACPVFFKRSKLLQRISGIMKSSGLDW